MRVLFSILFLSIGVVTIAQQITSGKIIYKETIKLKIDLEGSNPEMAKLIPSSQSSEKVLYFNATESLYKNYEIPKDIAINHEEDGNSFQFVMKVPENIIYSNKGTNTYLQYQDLMGKDFLISDNIESQKWKITGEKKTILNYNCQKAILNDTSKSVAAWFTTQIPVQTGPTTMAGLPGMTLAIEYDNGDRMTIATAVEPLPDSFVFEKPTKGKKVSKQEFEKIREEKMKEMGVIQGKGSGVKMIIREERH